jgi:hypothetical protein
VQKIKDLLVGDFGQNTAKQGACETKNASVMLPVTP